MPEDPRTFWSEFEECLNDIARDLHSDVMLFDSDVQHRIQQGILTIMREAAGDGEKAIGDLTALGVWLFLTGREHHARGYAPPVNRTDDVRDIPDTIDDMFKEN